MSIRQATFLSFAAFILAAFGAKDCHAAAIAVARQHIEFVPYVMTWPELPPECPLDCNLNPNLKVALRSLSVLESRFTSGSGRIANNPLSIFSRALPEGSSMLGFHWAAEVNSGARGIAIERKRADFVVSIENKTGFDLPGFALDIAWSMVSGETGHAHVDDVRYEYASYFSSVPFLPEPTLDPHVYPGDPFGSPATSFCDTTGKYPDHLNHRFERIGHAASCSWQGVPADELGHRGLANGFPRNAIAYVGGSLILDVRAISIPEPMALSTLLTGLGALVGLMLSKRS